MYRSNRFFKKMPPKVRKLMAPLVFSGGAFFMISLYAAGSGNMLLYEGAGDSEAVKSVAAEPPPPVHIKTPVPVKAVYMSSWVAGTPTVRAPLLDFVANSEINSIMIDIKDYTGKLSFETNNPIIDEVDSEERRISDIRALLDMLHKQNIYVIGRISVFQDPYIAKRVPEIAVQDKRGGIWKDKHGLHFVDPGAEYYWRYIVEIARESERLGFDEINFDYIRYPSDGQISQAVFPYAKGREKSVVLEDFFKYLREQLKDLPVPISADIFGLTMYTEDDLGIGQILEKIAPHFDYVAPMVYPSHYENGFEGYKNPAEHPYEVIFISLKKGADRMRKIGQDPKKIRPWIQDFDLGAEYGVPEIFKQKQAIQDAGLDSWMVWDPSNKYTKEAYRR